MRKILIIEDGKPTLLDETEFTEEGKLQDYIEEYPTVIPLSEIIEGASDLLCIGREVGAGSGSMDLLFIDKEGLLTIVETKLRKNREVRREVIGQIIEYASYVSQWTAGDVYKIANDYFLKSDKVPLEHRGSSLDTVMEKVTGSEFSVEDFGTKVEQNLKDGRLRLIIGVDKLVEELRATVTFLNSHSDFEILLLQVSSFEESESKKALIPLLFGYKPPSSSSSGQRKTSTEENFFEDANKRCSEEAVNAMDDLYRFSKEKAAHIGWGTGTARRSFIFHGVKRGLSFFTLYSDGAIGNNVGWTALWQSLDKETLIDFWVNELNKRLEINISREEAYIANIDDLVKRNKLEEFKNAVLALCQRLES
ncbi:hypothetical protein ACFLV4_06835 [Chloroflexota bacterium]